MIAGVGGGEGVVHGQHRLGVAAGEVDLARVAGGQVVERIASRDTETERASRRKRAR